MLVTMTVIGSEEVKSLSVDDRSVPTAPTLSFFSKWARGCPPAVVAHDHTGRDSATGEWHLGIGIRDRGNGTVRFTADLWKLDCNLASGAQAFLADLWRLQNAETPAYLLKRMERYFGPTHFEFDALPEQVQDWQEFLTGVMSREDFYSPIERWR